MTPETHEPGYDIPARPGDALADIFTPALIVDLDAFDRNIARMRDFAAARGLMLRAHAKTHKSADIARIQMGRGGAVGFCCQKVSEAEALVRAGIPDVLISNEVHGPGRAARIARMAGQARVAVCIDDADQARVLSAAAAAAGQTIGVLIEVDNGGGRCGVPQPEDLPDLARLVLALPGLRFDGLQAYNGRLQHIYALEDRRAATAAAAASARAFRDALTAVGIACPRITGAGTGSFELEAAEGHLAEIQCGSYIFGDVDYSRVEPEPGSVLAALEQSLFVLTEVISTPVPGRAACDAGHKSHALDSGLPVVDDPDLTFLGASDEHGVIGDPGGKLAPGDRLRLIPGHCDPTCNLHDWYVGIRNGRVEALWPVTARGKLF